MHGVLGISNLGGMGSYLGIPKSLGGSKMKIFSFVRDRLQSWTTGWTTKQLSRGGKECSGEFLVEFGPVWGTTLVSLGEALWEYAVGGWGFKNVDDFNYALLAKQLWRLIEAPKSLFARVLRDRYYQNSDPMDLIRSYSPSYGWRSIVSARSLINKGLIKRVGSGESISIWTDPWVPTQSPRPALSKGPLKDPSLKISHLIDYGTNSWRMDMLLAHFDLEDVALIRVIPLGSTQMADSLGWHFTKLWKYTVKSGYETERAVKQRIIQVIRYGPDITPLLAAVWRVSCPPKL
ncbi:PREDICTED: uncharacterized protein LOC104738262 [Camelina sativa]|uniref:Uncharacterized protein LOC104738262 n=1 Tax=Camelina sativa TaxID=90675 RepID=A0ABM0VIM2_CAMSA|nr:PREDICTED: uncharacterized protein LOC104738262 [Camelina sativa]